MTRFPRCAHPCCFHIGKCCGCCGKPKISDDAVRAAYCDLSDTFRRMRAIEARHADSIATLEPQEADHAEHDLEPLTPTSDCLGTGGPTPSAAPFNRQIAAALETLLNVRTYP